MALTALAPEARHTGHQREKALSLKEVLYMVAPPSMART